MKKKNIRIISVLLLLMAFVGLAEAKELKASKDYRMLLVANGDYIYASSLLGPKDDLARVKHVFEKADFYNAKSKVIRAKENLRGQDILSEIRETYKGSKEGDINYFYFGGHGVLKDDQAYITGVDLREGSDQGLISSSELRKELDKVKGTKVIILDSCHSGGFIDQQRSWTGDSQEFAFNKAFIRDFSFSSRRLFSSGDYKIITASSKEDPSWDLPVNENYERGGEFSTALVDGLGYRGDYMADKNQDGLISLSEIAVYTMINVKHSPVNVYPANDDFTFYEYEKIKDYRPEEVEVLEAVDFELEFNNRGSYGYEILKDQEVLFSKDRLEARPGKNLISWDSKDKNGQEVDPGKYRIKLYDTSLARKKAIGEKEFEKIQTLTSYDLSLEENKYGDILSLKLSLETEPACFISLELMKDGKAYKTIVDRDKLADNSHKEYSLDLRDYDIRSDEGYSMRLLVQDK